MTKVEDLIREHVDGGEDLVDNETILELARQALDLTNIVYPPADRFEECWCAVYDQFTVLAAHEARWKATTPPSQQGKDAARRVADGIRRAQTAVRDLDVTMNTWALQQMLHSEQLLTVLKICDDLAEGPVRPPYRTDGALKREAAKRALLILRLFDKPTATTKGSLFCELAAAFYGDAKADLHHQCREVKKQMRLEEFAAYAPTTDLERLLWEQE